MAQTKRKRRTKHRGNAAGTIEVRGRTGRPPTPEERKKQERATRAQARVPKPPTWNNAIKKALPEGAPKPGAFRTAAQAAPEAAADTPAPEAVEAETTNEGGEA